MKRKDLTPRLGRGEDREERQNEILPPTPHQLCMVIKRKDLQK